MKTARRMALSAFLCAGAATPALAAWDHIGSVTIDRHDGRDARSFDFGGPVSALQLRAEDGDVRCDAVRATFGNGSVSTIFSGRLREGRDTSVDLPGGNRAITNLAFDCDSRGHARIEISADVGQYHSEWMRGPNWQKSWAKVFNWGSNAVYDWKYLGQERFEGRDDSERAYVGWAGHGSEKIALMPVNADARCSHVAATFQNGAVQTLALHDGDKLRKGLYHALDLPGERRNVTSLSLRCRATDASAVTIKIFTSK
ncbi:MAG: hypothetical protein P4L57_11015 [Rhizomicrobium sp.]|nr:hypothetical protein [Rhizomicrobium sp.]